MNGNSVCFTPVEGVNNISLICTNECNDSDTCEVQVTLVLNSAPVCSTPNDTTIFQCTPMQVSLPVSATDIDGNLVGCSVLSGPGSIIGGYWVYTPSGDETANVTIRCTDECGAYCEKSFTVTFEINEAPVCTLPQDDSFFVCGDSTFSFPVSATDADNNLVGCTKISGPGDFDGADWTFTTNGPGVYTATFECTDECDASCGGTTDIMVTYNTPPVCIVPNDTTFFVGGDTTLSFTVSASDIDDNLVGCTMLSGPGTFDGTTWTFTTTAPGVYTAEFECLDECGASAFGGRGGFINITVLYNSPPACDIPPDDTFFVCDDTTFTFVVSATDPDDNLVGCTMLSGPGTFDGTNWSFTSTGTGVYTAEFECEDVYGGTCGGTTNITVNYNSSPVCTVPNDTTISQCSPAQVSLPVSATDVDNNLVGCSVVSGPGSIVGGYWVYTPSTSGTVNVTVRCTDECGAYCEGSLA
ncbi:MAG: hypothetical protein KAT85_03520, partial [candidate division Zixibacteria bacterium]|nr:hypothetical protein [candidate division Zixibacteria bacterium]